MLDPVSITDVSLLWTMKIQNNYVMFLQLSAHLQYLVHDTSIGNNHNFWCIHSIHMLCNTHVACLTNIYLETEQN